jgi:hypothetical protein
MWEVRSYPGGTAFVTLFGKDTPPANDIALYVPGGVVRWYRDGRPYGDPFPITAEEET